MGSQQPETCLLGLEGQHGHHHMFNLLSRSTQAPPGVVLKAGCCTGVTGAGAFMALPNSRVVYQLLFPPLFSSVVPGAGASGWLGVFWSGTCKAVSLSILRKEVTSSLLVYLMRLSLRGSKLLSRVCAEDSVTMGLGKEAGSFKIL